MNLWESFVPNLEKHFDILEEFYAQDCLHVLNFEHIIYWSVGLFVCLIFKSTLVTF